MRLKKSRAFMKYLNPTSLAEFCPFRGTLWRVYYSHHNPSKEIDKAHVLLQQALQEMEGNQGRARSDSPPCDLLPSHLNSNLSLQGLSRDLGYCIMKEEALIRDVMAILNVNNKNDHS